MKYFNFVDVSIANSVKQIGLVSHALVCLVYYYLHYIHGHINTFAECIM